MGLDIMASNNDYMRFNWTGSCEFMNWCVSNELPEPFIAWGGDNSGDELNLADNNDHIKKAKEWMKTFKKAYPALVTEDKPGKRLQNFVWGVWPWNRDNDTIESLNKRIQDNYYLGEAAAWYRMLQGAIKNKAIITYC